jgi:hypothetical protein
MAKAKAKPRPKSKPKATAKAKPKAKAKAKPVAKPVAKAKAARRRAIATAVRRTTKVTPPVEAAPTAPEPTESIAPFTIDETARGYALLLVDFGANAIATDGYTWEAVARRVVALSRLRDITYDPEPRMFCAYGPNHAAVTTLARRLADLYHAPDTLAGLVAELAATTEA